MDSVKGMIYVALFGVLTLTTVVLWGINSSLKKEIILLKDTINKTQLAIQQDVNQSYVEKINKDSIKDQKVNNMINNDISKSNNLQRVRGCELENINNLDIICR